MKNTNTRQTEPPVFNEARTFWKSQRGKFGYFFANGYCPNLKEQWQCVYLYIRAKNIGMAAKKLSLDMPVEKVYEMIARFLTECVSKLGELPIADFNEKHRARHPGKEFSDMCTKAQVKPQVKPAENGVYLPHPSPNAVKGKEYYTRDEVDALLAEMKQAILLEVMGMDAPIV